jgi:hypothetical protein
LSGNFPQLASVPLVAYDAGFRVIGHHQANDVRSVLSYSRGISPDGHVWRDGRHTCGYDALAVFIFNQTKPAGTHGFQIGMMAQGGNLDPVSHGRAQYAHPRGGTYIFTVDRENYFFQIFPPLLVLQLLS